jgi:hypothetical protein
VNVLTPRRLLIGGALLGIGFALGYASAPQPTPAPVVVRQPAAPLAPPPPAVPSGGTTCHYTSAYNIATQKSEVTGWTCS